MGAGDLDRRIQFRRATVQDDRFQTVLRWNEDNPDADNLGTPVWGSRKDASDAERAKSGGIEASMMSRFVVRSSSFTRGITPKDRLVCGGLVYDIAGIKEIGRLDRLEITATARTD
ncbi:head-tail adaptor protein [Paracoccus laeviglucosivorans]|uniref:Phage head-tail joining protein n=1 Tax=Paracoccus laeviglucosivorans TaxID=1197861 RepID=A0A521CX37_9RHOB|nr:head-tail adaptor protein [Paracoccus laeviglucosivorans]SMO64026.1 Phage head-tail joining protein [Paracoccus laeviglucosivorans]